MREVSLESPRVLAVLCTCGERMFDDTQTAAIASALETDPAVSQVITAEAACTQEGLSSIARAMNLCQPMPRVSVVVE